MKVLILLVLNLILVSCDKEQIKEAINKPQGNIVIGASNMRGNPDSSISKYLNNNTNENWINKGIGGQSCKQVADRFKRDVLKYNPKIVILNCGQNGLNKDNWESDIKENIIFMQEIADNHNIDLYILNLHHDKKRPELIDRRDLINTWLLEQKYNVIDFLSFSENHLDLYRDDIHFNDYGYELLGQFVSDYI